MNTLRLSTNNAKTEVKSRLEYRLTQPMNLDGYIALNSIRLWYNWHNINQDNNKLTYQYNNALYEVILPNGSYSIKDINNIIHYTMEHNGHIDSSKDKWMDDRYGINLYQNTTYNRLTLKITPGYEISFRAGMAKVLGANPDKYYTSDGNLQNVPQLENVSSVQVHCKLQHGLQ